jgi:hypothetical protein
MSYRIPYPSAVQPLRDPSHTAQITGSGAWRGSCIATRQEKTMNLILLLIVLLFLLGGGGYYAGGPLIGGGLGGLILIILVVLLLSGKRI